ncbi:helix-turn-helix domain-containing protein [Streptomyces sp. NBC_01264]|uniref:helix-turn-helix domain-containing protein n=1 Tax=Streptomyces sp. NBC_01264 TaxID=2903804 RepID=UPI0022515315|nr:helix-turn-helix domain-containing protein [Streptomyces sp. NBC_01264]MCX4778132.1 helix-turn-helix domain-containing protein [Streptomyces sp. NBC_01264]
MTAPARPMRHLLPAQEQMLQLAADGATDREIAHQLRVPLATIRSQWRYHLRPALGGIDRTHTIALAVAAGIAHPVPKESAA